MQEHDKQQLAMALGLTVAQQLLRIDYFALGLASFSYRGFRRDHLGWSPESWWSGNPLTSFSQ